MLIKILFCKESNGRYDGRHDDRHDGRHDGRPGGYIGRAAAPLEPPQDYTGRGEITIRAPNGDAKIQKCLY